MGRLKLINIRNKPAREKKYLRLWLAGLLQSKLSCFAGKIQSAKTAEGKFKVTVLFLANISDKMFHSAEP